MPELFADTRINPGGLMRCCFQTIHEYVDAHMGEAAPESLVISCRYEMYKESMNIILEKGEWRWNHD